MQSRCRSTRATASQRRRLLDGGHRAARLSCQPSQLMGAPGTVCTRYRLTAPIGKPRLHRTDGRHVQSRSFARCAQMYSSGVEIARRTRRADTVCPRRIRVGAFEMRPETRTPLGPELQRSVARDKVDLPTSANGRAMEAWRIFAAPGGGRSPPRPTQIILRKLRVCN